MRVEINIHADNFNHFVPALSRVRARIPMVMGGAGAGKSVAVAQILILSRVVTEGQSGIALRKYETDVRKSIFPLMKWVINQFGLAKYFRINKTRMHFQFIPNGAEVYCLGVSDPESLKSITVEKGSLNWAWLEEANQFKINDFREIQRRIRGISAYPKQFWMTFNPVSKLNWLKKELIDKNEPGIELFKFTYKDNVFLSQDDKEILENLAQTSPHDYRIYTLGEWGEPSSGLVFPHYEVITQSVWDALPKDVDTIFGIDWGYNAPTAVAEYKILKENTGLPSVFARQILYQTGLVTDDIIRVIKPLVTGKYVYCDGAEPDRIAQLREVGILAKAWDKDVLTSIDFCKRLKLFVLGKDFENELENYRWLENTDKVDPKSEDHLIDTFRGAVWTHLRNHFAYRLLPLSYK
ncbi:MAG: PBSX family phage terminase large subunit [Bacteroidia bacterium]|nr:PBSX family phage terminase large subunit [Bacteroidia bacterium]